jgi:hypothetical protein
VWITTSVEIFEYIFNFFIIIQSSWMLL